MIVCLKKVVFALAILLSQMADANNEEHLEGKDVTHIVSVDQEIDHNKIDNGQMGHVDMDHKEMDHSELAYSEVGHAEMDRKKMYLGKASMKTSDTAPVTHVIDQKNKTFSHDSITINVGDEVEFVNSDSYFHNVYSLSESAQFDLGSYPKGQSRSITFDKPGEVTARCAIHPQMKLKIMVEEK